MSVLRAECHIRNAGNNFTVSLIKQRISFVIMKRVIHVEMWEYILGAPEFEDVVWNASLCVCALASVGMCTCLTPK
jgi:hypothetical protein